MTGHTPTRRGGHPAVHMRLMSAIWVVGLGFLILLWRLYALQILRGEEYADKGRQNFVQRVEIQHDRGIIYDRYGRILVDNRPSLNLQVTPHFLGSPEESNATLDRVATLVGFSYEELAEIKERVASKRGLERFRPLLIKRDLDANQVDAIESDRGLFKLDGVEVVEGRRRTYRYGRTAAHLLGFVNEIGRGQLEREQARGNPLHYERGDLLGREGVEHRYESDLRGRDGWEKVVVDAKGRRLGGSYVENLLGQDRVLEPKPGHNVYLTLDLDLQLAAEEAFDGRAGAVVVMDPRHGEILALVSVPAFDPNLVSGALAKEEKARLDSDPLKPWINRALQGQYAPGSTFKIVTSLAALLNKATSGHEHIMCPGYYRLGRRAWRCHRDAGHGYVDLKDALKVSCDTYYYAMSTRIGIDAIAEAARMMGAGRRTGIRLRGEQPGLMPDEAFHNRVDRATGGYQKGMALNTSIGQGSVLTTPLQLAQMFSIVANGGTLRRPRIVSRVETADFRVVRRTLAPDGDVREEVLGRGPELLAAGEPDSPETKLDVPPEIWAAIHEGLVAVAQEPGGTAYWRRSRLTSMAGKTGTSQVVRLGTKRLKSEEVPYEERDHAWFAAYAPAEDPELVVAVLNEHSGHGSSMAAPIAVKVIDAWYQLKQQRALQAKAEEQADRLEVAAP